jgi:voltage-gated potassium channel
VPAAAETDEARLKRWEQATVWLGIGGSVLFLVVYSWVVLDTTMSLAVYRLLIAVLAIVWVYFFVDYAVRLALAHNKARFVRRNLVDLASVLIPVARPFRLLSGVARLRAFRGNTGSHLRRRVIVVAATFVVMFIYTISLAVYQVERDAHGSNIHSFGDALWWACVTMATVGYGDYYPVTVAGRMLAVILMIGGIGIVGTASATIVSYLNESTQHLRHRPPAGDEQKDDASPDREQRPGD